MRLDIMRRFVQKYLFIQIVICCFLSAAIAQDFPKPIGYVNDFAQVIPESYQRQINQICHELKQKTGAEIADVTIPELGDNYIEDYAVRLFERWGIGEQGKDNGVLILNAVKERQIRIEIGYGIEGIIPDAQAGRIRDNYLIPYLIQGDYGKGHLFTVAAIAKKIADDYGVQLTGNIDLPQSGGSQSKSKGIGGLFTIMLILFLIFGTRGKILPWLLLGSLFSNSGRGRGGWGGFSGGGGFGGGFGGFGGGMSGGGGASGSY